MSNQLIEGRGQIYRQGEVQSVEHVQDFVPHYLRDAYFEKVFEDCGRVSGFRAKKTFTIRIEVLQ